MTATVVAGDDPRVRRSLIQVAGWCMPGCEPIEPVTDPAVADALVDAAAEHRLSGVLAVAADAGELSLPPAALDAAREHHRHALVWCLRLEVELLRLAALLSHAGVAPVVLKGAAAAHLDAAEPSLRPFADIDLLVAGTDVDRTVALIEADGTRRSWAERRPGFDHRFAKSVTLRRPDGLELDLHRSLCDGAHGFRIPLRDLFDQAVPWQLAGTELRALSPVHRVLHTAYHLVLGSRHPRLMSLRDLAGHLTDDLIDREEVVAEAGRWRGEAVLASAVLQAVDTLGVSAPAWERWARALRSTPRERAIIERQRQEGSGIGRAKLDALRELGWGDRGAYALALAVPSRAHLRSRGLTRWDLVSR